MLSSFFNDHSRLNIKLISLAYLFITFFFLKEVFSENSVKAPLEKKDLLEFVEIIQNDSLRDKVKASKTLFYKGQTLPSNYRWVFKDYKVDSHDGMIDYLFLNEEAFGRVRWKIQMHVQEATSEIVFFEATASKES